jgi:hypothetical protein
MDQEDNTDIKEKLNLFENTIRKHRGKLAVVFTVLILISLVFLFVQGEKAFTKTVIYSSPDGFYNCNETYKFGRIQGDKCDLPENSISNVPKDNFSFVMR